MCLWARSVSVCRLQFTLAQALTPLPQTGTRVEADVAVHCDQLEKKESERQGDGMHV
jgi:hypothetical protein